MSSAAGIWLGAKPNKPASAPAPLLKALSSAAATADWLRVSPLIWPIPEARFSCTSVGV
jgi:hypothetical protein